MMLWAVVAVMVVLWLIVLVPPLFDHDRHVMDDVADHQRALAALGKATRQR